MPTILYQLLSSPLFYIVVVLWLIVDIAAEETRRNLFARVNSIIHKPVIFEKDNKPEDVPLYARRLLETISVWSNKTLQEPFADLRTLLRGWSESLVKIVSKKDKPLLVLGYGISFILLLIYLYLDAVGVITALVSRGFVSPNVPDIFLRYEYVAIGGSLFALLVAGYTLAQMTRPHSEISDWDTVTGVWRSIARFVVYVLIASGIFTVLLLGLELMIGLGYFKTESDIIVALVDFAATVLTRLNVVLASVLLFEDGIKGFILLAVLVVSIVRVIAYVVDKIAVVVGWLLPFLIDVVYRILLVLLFVLWFLFTTPIILFFSVFKKLGAAEG